MSSVWWYCVLCGLPIGSHNPEIDFRDENEEFRWKHEFRAVCRDGTGPVFLSGVGLYNNVYGGIYIAPPDASSRWDDPGYDREDDKDAIRGMRSQDDKRHGFLFHNACWQLFADSAPTPLSVNHKRIFEVLSSMPVHCNLMFWEHEYDGVIYFMRKARNPWEPTYYDYTEDEGIANEFPLVSPFEDVDTVYELGLLPHNTARTTADQDSMTSGATLVQKDDLQAFPKDVIFMISELLTTPDFFNARLASRAFTPLFYSQSFWRSRFTIGTARGWLFEVRKSPSTVPFDLWLLYRVTSEHRLDFCLRNRRRLCNLFNCIHPLVAIQWMSARNELPLAHNPEGQELVWHDIASVVTSPIVPNSLGDSDTKDSHFAFGSTILRDCDCSVSGQLRSLTLYYCYVGEKCYISGMRLESLVTSKPVVAELGYRSREQTYYEVPSDSLLLGFKVAIGSGGVHDIQAHFVRKTDHLLHISPPRDNRASYARTLRTMTEGGISAIKAAFDGCKMITFAVGGEPTETMESYVYSLREEAIWYPDIPDSDLCINEASFTDCQLPMASFSPLFWTLFGGRGGYRLATLTSVHVLICDNIIGMTFGYNGNVPEVGDETTELGRHCEDDIEGGRVIDAQTFNLDGPSGERITAVRVRMFHDPEGTSPVMPPNAVSGLEVLTSHNRSRIFGNGAIRPESGDQFHEWQEKMFPEPGTTITGFYTNQPCEAGRAFTCLGIISESIDGFRQDDG